MGKNKKRSNAKTCFIPSKHTPWHTYTEERRKNRDRVNRTQKIKRQKTGK